MGPKTKHLHNLLAETIDLLNSCEEKRWSQWMEKSKNRIENSDFSGITYLLRAYGGMGSFNDLIIHPLNGHKIKESEVEPVNGKLSDLRQKMYELAVQIRREFETER